MHTSVKKNGVTSPLPKIDINNTIGNYTITLTAGARNITGLLASTLSLTNCNGILKDLISDTLNVSANTWQFFYGVTLLATVFYIHGLIFASSFILSSCSFAYTSYNHIAYFLYSYHLVRQGILMIFTPRASQRIFSLTPYFHLHYSPYQSLMPCFLPPRCHFQPYAYPFIGVTL